MAVDSEPLFVTTVICHLSSNTPGSDLFKKGTLYAMKKLSAIYFALLLLNITGCSKTGAAPVGGMYITAQMSPAFLQPRL
jgi:hypothetical protein